MLDEIELQENNNIKNGEQQIKLANEAVDWLVAELSKIKVINLNDKVLDVGCGEGYAMERFVKLGFKKENIVGLDLLKSRAKIAEEKGYRCYANDIRKWYIIRAFDIIFCSHTLEHVKDWRLALDNMVFSLNKDGVCLIIIPLESQEEVHSAAHHSFFKNGEQIKKHLIDKKIKIIYENERKRTGTKREFWCLLTKPF